MFVFVSCGGNDPAGSTKSLLAGKIWSVEAQKDGSDESESLKVAITDTKIIVIDSSGKVVSTQPYTYQDELYFIGNSGTGISISADSSGLNLGAGFTVEGYDSFKPRRGSQPIDSSKAGELNNAEPGSTVTIPPPSSNSILPGLIGAWTDSGEYNGNKWTDDYIITATTLTHASSYSGISTGSIVYVYNFDNASGCLIVKYAEDNYNAVYFQSLTATSVTLGDAFDSNGENYDSSVATLAEAIERFRPENAKDYGGG
ncbi:MAG: hypothetical protein LBH15_01185, partial [Treponema sp.]|nr:hypothetical protein [Treponema sp.]